MSASSGGQKGSANMAQLVRRGGSGGCGHSGKPSPSLEVGSSTRQNLPEEVVPS